MRTNLKHFAALLASLGSLITLALVGGASFKGW